MVLLRAFSIVLFSLLFASLAWAGSISHEAARRVALGQVRHHVVIYGDWNGVTSPTIADHEVIPLGGGHSAYHFPVSPTGFVIVSAYDMLSPVPFYSVKSSFDVSRKDNPKALESLIFSRLKTKADAAVNYQVSKAASAGASSLTGTTSRVGDAWNYFNGLGGSETGQNPGRSLSGPDPDKATDIIRGATVAPLLSTVWGQDDPYNLETPDDQCDSGRTLTGCVATAWAQILKYWQWPPQSMGGQGSYNYAWQSGSGNVNLGVDFTNTEAYDWANMPNDLKAAGTTQVQKDAVSKLMYYLAVSADMDFGCPESPTGSGSERWGDQVLDSYFRYKSMNEANNRLAREDYTAAQWIALIKNELDADPPRPIIFSMGSQVGWHEVVIDGYEQSSPLDKVHVNFGWDGTYDAYFDITDDDDFNTGDFNWSVDNEQVIVVGIEPENNPPQVQAGADTAAQEGDTVALSVASASDPEGVGISRYQWAQTSGPAATIANADSASPTITAPNVHATTDLVFQVKVYDANRAFGTDTCTITVSNSDGSTTPPPPSSDGGGGGGCFIANFLSD